MVFTLNLRRLLVIVVVDDKVVVAGVEGAERLHPAASSGSGQTPPPSNLKIWYKSYTRIHI